MEGGTVQPFPYLPDVSNTTRNVIAVSNFQFVIEVSVLTIGHVLLSVSYSPNVFHIV